MSYKGRCGTFFRDFCNTIDKNDKKSVYLLFSRKSNRRRREFKQTISSITLNKNICRGQDAVLHSQRISDSNAYHCGGFARCCEEGERRKLHDRVNVFFRRSSFMKLQQDLT